MGYTDFQKAYAKPEVAFGDGAAGDFSGATGQRLWLTERFDTTSLKQKMTEVNYTLGSYDEIGPEGIVTFKESSGTLNMILPGSTRSGGCTEDSFSKFGNYAIGKRYAAGADDACDAACTQTSVIITGATVYTAGKSCVMINGEVRLIDTWTGGTKTMTFETPLSAAPTAATVVYDVESFDLTDPQGSLALGFEHDDPAYDCLVKGCVFNIGSLSLVNAETAKISLELMAQDHTIGTAAVSAAATNEIPTGEVLPTAGGGYFVKDYAGTGVNNPCVKSAELTPGIEFSRVDCFGAANGIGNFQRIPSEGGSTLSLVIYEDETPMFAEFVSLVGSTRENIIQMGHVAGSVVGAIQPIAAIGTADGYPTYTFEDRKEYFTTTFKGTPMILFRA